MSSTGVPGKATRKEWSGLAVLVFPVLLMSIDLTVLSLAIPAISDDLRPTSSQLLWIVDIYAFLLAGLLILMGTLGDRIGRRRMLLIGAGAFGCASALAAFSTSAEMLIVSRALLGIGGATLMPSTLSIIRNLFRDPGQRRTAVSIWIAAFAGGAGLGPVVGGALLQHFWWGSVFLINIPVIVVLLALAPALLPESKDPSPGPFDLTSAVIVIAAMLSVVWGLKHIASHGLSWAGPVAIIAGGVFSAAFVLRQQRLRDPLIDVTLFRIPTFSIAVAINIFGVFALTGLLFFLPQYLQLVLGKSPLAAGLWCVPIAGGAVGGALAAPAAAARTSLGWVIGGGLLVSAIGYLGLSTLGVDEQIAVYLIGGILVGTGVGLADTVTNDAIISTSPPQRAGAAAGISETTYELGGALGTAVLGSIGASVYRRQLVDSVPDGLPVEVVEVARETLGAAAYAAVELPAEVALPFRDAARTAFTSGMTTAFTIAAVLLFVSGGAALVALRRTMPTVGDAEETADLSSRSGVALAGEP